MITYPKINAPFKRDKQGNLIDGDWATDELCYLQDNTWFFTEKVDGTNIRVKLTVPEVYGQYTPFLSVEYAGRTDNAQIPEPLLLELEKQFPTLPTQRRFLDHPTYSNRYKELLAWMLENDLSDVILFGEGYGPKIQGGGKYRDPPGFVLFDVYIDGWWLNYNDVMDIGDKLDVEVVPGVGQGTLQDGIDIIQAGLNSVWGEFPAEGVVAKPVVQMFDRKGNPIWTKLKVKDFAQA